MSKERRLVGHLTALGVVFGAAATGVVTEACGSDSSEKTLPIPQASSEKEFFKEKTPEDLQRLVTSYLVDDEVFGTVFALPIDIEGERIGSLDPNFVEEIHQKAREHVIDGAYLAELVLPQKEEIWFDSENQTVVIDNLPLDLDNDLHLHIAASIIRAKFNIDSAQNVTNYWGQNPEEIEEEIKDLRWLAMKNPNIIIEPGSFAILPSDYLVTISRLFQEFEEIKVPFPRTIRFKVYEDGDPGSAWYEGHDSENSFRITVTNISGKDCGCLIHEGGHFGSDAWTKKNDNPELRLFSQSNFEQMIETIKAKYDTEDQLTKEKDLKEEYAEVFKEYYTRGNDFRWKIGKEEPGSVKREVFEKEYEFFQRFWGGKEFRTDGVEVEYLDPVFPIAIGDIIEITDTDFKRPGIFLRPEPSLEIDSSYPVAWDEDDVQLIDGPVTIVDENGKKVSMWKVRIGSFYNGEFYSRDYDPAEGWMSKEYFGRIIWLSDQIPQDLIPSRS